MMESRRSFLKRLTGFAVLCIGLVPLFRFLTPEQERQEEILTTDSSKVPEGGALIFSDKRVAVLKMDGKITAVSLTCTHLGCTLSLKDDTFACPCHGSVFDLEGNVIKGPAVKKLPQFIVKNDGKKLTVLRGDA